MKQLDTKWKLIPKLKGRERIVVVNHIFTVMKELSPQNYSDEFVNYHSKVKRNLLKKRK